MNNHRYRLEPYNGIKSRHLCPSCGKKNEFVRYIDKETGLYLHPQVGRCNREEKCGYHYKPKEYFEAHKIKNPAMVPTQEPITVPSYIDMNLIQKAMKSYELNKFARFLESHFPIDRVYSTLKKYYVGTSTHWQGATVFPQIDTQRKVRTAKVMLYDSHTGKRIKKPYNHITWLHAILKKENYNLKQCLFGEHLLPAAHTVCIVESEKTAIISALAWPKYCWVATGGKNGANMDPYLFANKKVILFPDLGVDWSKKSDLIPGAKISRVLERYATKEDWENGSDLADMLLSGNIQKNTHKPPAKRKEQNPAQKTFEKMAAKNPILNKFKETFDLQMSGVEYSRQKELTREELIELAYEKIGECTHEDGSKIPHLTEMLKQGIIRPADPLTDKYYINGSTPF